ncbi:MAG: zinc ribbon domain-containing protein [Actinomycetota bacterium]|nr:zinc ribbon domain-containing protein [Actinomycetota bacterium]
MAIYCPLCGAENPNDARYCNVCLTTVGFEDLERPIAKKTSEGYLTEYPSSFKEEGVPRGAGGYTPVEEEKLPPAGPVDIGEYAKPSGAPAAKSPPPPSAEPVDIGTYGVPSGIPVEGGKRKISQEEQAISSPSDYYAVRLFEEKTDLASPKAVKGFILPILLATGISLCVEVVFGFSASGAVMQSNYSLQQLVMLLVLGIPAGLCGYNVGKGVGLYGWLFGLASVAAWGCILRPLYWLVLSTLAEERFVFSFLFNSLSIIMMVCLYLPLGAFLGWLGERESRPHL